MPGRNPRGRQSSGFSCSPLRDGDGLDAGWEGAAGAGAGPAAAGAAAWAPEPGVLSLPPPVAGCRCPPEIPPEAEVAGAAGACAAGPADESGAAGAPWLPGEAVAAVGAAPVTSVRVRRALLAWRLGRAREAVGASAEPAYCGSAESPTFGCASRLASIVIAAAITIPRAASATQATTGCRRTRVTLRRHAPRLLQIRSGSNGEADRRARPAVGAVGDLDLATPAAYQLGRDRQA